MPPDRSRSGRPLIQSTRRDKIEAIAEFVTRPKKKRTASKSTKKTRRQRQPTPPQSSDVEQEEPTEEPERPTKPSKSPIDPTECKFLVTCVTNFNDRKFEEASKRYRLSEFNVHEYNAESLKVVHEYAEKMKVGYELLSAVAMINGVRLTKSTKSIKDSKDWQDMEDDIEDYMREGIKLLRVDYVLTYSKTRRRMTSHMDEDEDDVDGDLSSQKKHGPMVRFFVVFYERD
jgi:hypothetical protein